MIVDVDPSGLQSTLPALNERYGKRFQVLHESYGQAALARLPEAGQVALVLACHELPDMTGLALLEQVADLAPGAKRVLLVNPNDNETVLTTVDQAEIDQSIRRWQPVEEHLLPALDMLLQAWETAANTRTQDICIVGYRWSRDSHTVKNFLSRNLVPYRWLEIEDRSEAHEMLSSAGLSSRRLPVVFFSAEDYLVQPDMDQLAKKVGLHQRAEQRFYDLVVVGGGPAGLSAAVYGASEGLDTLLIESETPGGQAGASAHIENYLGFPSGVSGNELTRRAVAQARRFGVEILTPQTATGLRLRGHYRLVQLANGDQVACHALLIATGVSYVQFSAEGMEKLTGAGIYYGAVITEAMSCQGHEVFILGGGNSAGQAAMYLSRFASHITMVTNTPNLADTMSHYLIEQIEDAGNIKVRTHSTIKAVQGEHHLEGLTILNKNTGESETLAAVALFIYIGARPRTQWLGDVLLRDGEDYLLTGHDLVGRRADMPQWQADRDPLFLESSVPGVFVAGDTRHGSVKRIASSVGEGAMAITLIHQYLANL